MQSRQQLIDLWVRKQQQSSADITLCCFEKTGDFCHRYQVGGIVQEYLAEQWGGEIGTSQKPHLTLIPGAKITQSATYSPQVLSLIEKCRESGYPVVCSRASCGYYQVSLVQEQHREINSFGQYYKRWSPVQALVIGQQLRHPSLSDKYLDSFNQYRRSCEALYGANLRQVYDQCKQWTDEAVQMRVRDFQKIKYRNVSV
ncbi:hypothetical protein [aff. Roholtiella sp. LEGE 12411]|uniref:hypothetical protein n=1 Tax=aff. Roholtiella sp. LEGE 12411 TaxID=1828822 RepID=UPI0018812F27|nr:hypothetical protein [aff. Roholtiella sp. LEGE 12411]MBE9038187.1 hypothetical protein [aff. Roholtiella sp. LEGE 12411]